MMPPSTGQLAILLIIITLAESGALGDLLEAPGWPRNRFLHAALGFVKFTERVIMPYGGLSGRWARVGEGKLSSPSGLLIITH